MLTLSARDNGGLDGCGIRSTSARRFAASGALDKRRADQAVSWMREIFEQRLLAAFKGGKRAARHFHEFEDKVRAGKITPAAAAQSLATLPGSRTTTRPSGNRFPEARALVSPSMKGLASYLRALAPFPALADNPSAWLAETLAEGWLSPN